VKPTAKPDMHCPVCGSTVSLVTTSKATDRNERIRRRKCMNRECNNRWTTYTPAEKVVPPSDVYWGPKKGKRERKFIYIPSDPYFKELDD
jgi:transcriptional regulator NrdR family protein